MLETPESQNSQKHQGISPSRIEEAPLIQTTWGWMMIFKEHWFYVCIKSNMRINSWIKQWEKYLGWRDL